MSDLFYREAPGPEPALLLIHGFPFDGRMWDPQVEALRGRRRLLVPDLPGFGRSPAPGKPASIADYASALGRFLEVRGAQKAVPCGFSMGGYVALAFAARFPERLAGLVLADTRAGADTGEGKAARTLTAERVLAEGPAFLADTLPDKLLAPKTFEGDPGLVERVRSMIRTQPRGEVAAALLAMRDRPDRTAELSHVPCPALLLCGAEDALTPPAEMRAMATAISGGRFAEIPGAAHLSNLEKPEAFNRHVAGFLEIILAEAG